MAYLSVTNHNARREGGDDPFVVTQGISLPLHFPTPQCKRQRSKGRSCSTCFLRL